MSVSATVEKQNAKKESSETKQQHRDRLLQEIGVLAINLAENERAIGRLLIEAKATYPDTTAGRQAFQAWSEKATGRKYGMVKRWITTATVLQRVPSFASVSTKADVCQMVAGLPDEDIVSIATKLEGKPSTETQVRKVMLQVSDRAKQRETKRITRETDAAKTSRVKNDAAVEGFVKKGFPDMVEAVQLLTIEGEKDIEAAILHAMIIVADYCNVGLKGRAYKQMVAKYRKGDHLATDDNS